MSSNLCIQRLRKEYRDIVKNPVENIRAAPKEGNILEWHYVITGTKGSVYEGGYYHGIVTFPSNYPYKPPSIQMYTPNGRFKVHTRLCLSMSDFHPETWNPMWSVSTILMGLYSFMIEETPTHGSIVTSSAVRRQFAKGSMAVNIKNKIFCELFPDLVEQYEKEMANALELDPSSAADPSNRLSTDPSHQKNSVATSLPVMVGLLAAILIFSWAFATMAI